jgi:putative ABC transport system substrate-binding protein
MNRRAFLTLLGGAAAWPFMARAQQTAMPVVGFLHSASPGPYAPLVAEFRRSLSDAGYVEGRTLAIEYRWAEGQYDRLPALAADLVRRRVAVLVASGGGVAAFAAKAATATIPIVFTSGNDPIAMGLVTSLSRPGANLTGVHLFLSTLDPKKLGLLRAVVPQASLIAVLYNPNNLDAGNRLTLVQEAAHAVGQKIHILHAGTDVELDAAFATFDRLKAGAILVSADAFFNSRRDHIVALAARYAIPAIYEGREYAAAGGLMSYGTSFADGYRQLGVYTARVLKGEKPADLPVMQSTKFELVVNLTTAKTLGLELPPGLVSAADEVIE